MKRILNSYSWTALLLTILMSFSFNQAHTQEEIQEVVYLQLYVDGLACPFCAYGLEKKIKKIKGVKDFNVQMQDGFVTFNVPKNNKPSKEKLHKIVEDSGFTLRKINFSDEPFNTKKEKDEQ